MTTLIKYLSVTTYPELGSGSFGIVYKALDIKTDCTVAVKRIKYTGSPEIKRLATQELEALQKLPEHQNILKAIDNFEHDGFIWIVMDFCSMGDLKNYLDGHKEMTIAEQVDKMHQSACGIAYLHQQDPPIFHRDIKLKNFLIKCDDEREVVKVCDFGLAKYAPSESTKGALYQRCTFGTLVGSPPYMAPEFSAELETGLQYDCTADVFSLGLVFQQILEPNRPDYYPLSVEAKRESKEVNIGYEMVQCHKNKHQLPTVIDTHATDDITTQRLKRIVRNMTHFKSVDRKNITEVEQELTEIEAELAKQKDDMENKRTIQQRLAEMESKSASMDFTTLDDMTKDQTSTECNTEAGTSLSLSVLTRHELWHEKYIELQGLPAALCVIGTRLYSCQWEDGIHVYSTNLQHLQHIEAGRMISVRGVTGLPDGSLVVAAQIGLYHLSSTGKVQEKITWRECYSVTSRNHEVYVAKISGIFLVEPCVHIYAQVGGRWMERKLCTLPCIFNHFNTLALAPNVLYAACLDEDIIRAICPRNGTVLRTHGRHGKSDLVGLVYRPRATQCDAVCNLLVSNRCNNRLQLLCADGTWQLIRTSEIVKQPQGAVMFKECLFVSTYAGKLHKFNIQHN